MKQGKSNLLQGFSITINHPVTLNGELIPYTNYPTTPGVTYDRGLTFGEHIQNIITKAKTRLNVLRALTNITFDHSKEDITQVYKQYISPILSYAQPSWEPSTAKTNIDRPQITQNSHCV